MKCSICNSFEDHPIWIAEEKMFGMGGAHPYFSCVNCGCIQIFKIPPDMEIHYGSNYYSFSKIKEKAGFAEYIGGLRNRYSILRSGVIGRLAHGRRPITTFNFLGSIRETLSLDSRILDVGCGAGFLVGEFRRGGFHNAVGIDPFIDHDLEFRGRPLVLKQSLESIGEQFNLIMFHHSLEHMPDQHGALKLAFQRLSPRGSCIVRIPLCSSYAWERYGLNWVQLDAPRHLFLHTEKSFTLLARKIGFECSEIEYDSTSFQFWGSEQYANGIPLTDSRSYGLTPSKSMFSSEQIRNYELKSKELNSTNRGDQAIFRLKKPAAV